MPRVAVETPQTYESITRPITLCVSRQILSILSLPQDLKILFPGSSEQAPMPGSVLGYDGDPSTFKYTGQLRVEMTENPVEDRILATAVYQKENVPTFVDDKLGVKIHPIYSGTEIVLSCQYRAPSRVLAKRFRDDALIRTAMGRKENLHELTYHYSWPYQYLHLLKSIYDMRERVAGYGESFDKWVASHITQRATNITNLVGEQMQLAIAEHQVCPQGFFDFSALPEREEKDKEGGTWVLNFEYRMTYDKVVGSAIQYPLVVHNQMLEPQWFDDPVASGHQINPADRRRVPSLSRHAFDHFAMNGKSKCTRSIDPVVIPRYDDWEPATVHPDTSAVVTVMLMVDLNDPTALVNLNDLGTYSIDADILAYMTTEAPFLGVYGQSAIYLALYCGDVPLDDGSLTVDANLEVRSTADLDPRLRYHLRIALVSDILSLPSAAVERLRRSGKACQLIMSTLQWRTFGRAVQPALIGGTLYPTADLRRLAQRVNDKSSPHQVGVLYHMQTVGNYTIVTEGLENANHERNPSGPGGNNDTDPATGGGVPLPQCGS